VAMEEFAFPNRHALATAIAERLADALRDGIKRNGTASLVVPGGTTPVDVFEHLAGADLAWEKINVIPCDERWVAVDHADSNEGLIRRHLMIGKATRAQVCTLYRPLPSPSDTLPDVTRALQTVKRPFDAVFLGMGEDGHFASLFPGRTETASALALDQPQDLMALNTPAKGYPRIGLTLRALTDTRTLILAVPGAAKRVVLQNAIAHIDKNDLPVAALFRQNRVKVDIMLSP